MIWHAAIHILFITPDYNSSKLNWVTTCNLRSLSPFVSWRDKRIKKTK